jgi:hypothetical protein
MILKELNFRLTGHGVKKPVFGTVHACWPDDGSFGESISDSSLSGVLGSVECRCRVGRCVQVRNVDQTGYTDVGTNFRDSLGRPVNQLASPNTLYIVDSLDVDILVRVVSTCQLLAYIAQHDCSPGLPVSSSQVVDDIRMPNTFRNLIRIPSIPFKRYNLTQITHDSQMPLFILVSIRYNDLRTSFTELGDSVST